MKKRPPVALVSAGKLTDSPITRFWGLPARLGPVKSSSLRLSSRMVNTLRAGHPVDTYSEFARCGVILISVPDDTLAATVSEIVDASLSWANKAVVLCSLSMGSQELQPLEALGAVVGSVTPIPGFEEHKYLVEGDRTVAREMRHLIEHRGTRVIAIEPGLKPFYLACLTCTGPLFHSLLLAATECIRPAGVTAADATAIVERQIERTLRSYFKAGKKAYQAPPELSRQLQVLEMIQPALAQYVEQTAHLAAKLMSSTK